MMIQRGNTSVSNTFNFIEADHYINFKGGVIETTVTNRGLVVESWIRDIYSTYSGTRIIVALDFKGKLSSGEGIFSMCVDQKCLVLQLSQMGSIPSTLRTFLADAKVMFITVNALSLVDYLKCSVHRIVCSRILYATDLASESYVDANITSKLPYYGTPTLEELAKFVLGFEIEKPRFVITSDWGGSELFVEQIRYAAIDAYATYKIGLKLLSSNI